MNIRELIEFFECFDKKTVFQFGLSKPFSWRGSYDQVAFQIIEEPTSCKKILKNINLSLTKTFDGYKGGKYKYNKHTTINFEAGFGLYSDNNYLISTLFRFLFPVDMMKEKNKHER